MGKKSFLNFVFKTLKAHLKYQYGPPTTAERVSLVAKSRNHFLFEGLPDTWGLDWIHAEGP